MHHPSHEALVGMRNSSVGPPWKINQMTHCTISECSAMELHLSSAPLRIIVDNATSVKLHLLQLTYIF